MPADVGRVKVQVPAVLEAWIVTMPEVPPASLICPVVVPDWPMVNAGDSQDKLAEAPNAPELLNCSWVLDPLGVAPPEAEIVITLGELVAMAMLAPATREVVALLKPLIAVIPEAEEQVVVATAPLPLTERHGLPDEAKPLKVNPVKVGEDPAAMFCGKLNVMVPGALVATII